MELKAGYKQTEVGVIPEDWKIRDIGQSMRLTNGRAFAPSEWSDTGIPIIRIQNLNSPDIGFNYYHGTIDEKHLIEPGNLLFAWSGTTGSSFGARLWSGPTGVLNQHIFKVDPKKEEINTEYAYLVLHKAQEDIEKQAHGFKASFVHIKKSDLIKTPIAFPSNKTEQQAIASALSDADELIESLEQLLAKKRNLKQGAMQELMTGKRRLAGFSGKWPKKTVAELERSGSIALSRGKVISKKDISNDPGDFPIYSSSVQNDGLFGCYGKFMFNEELITWSVDGGGHFFYRPKHKFSVTNVCGFMRVHTDINCAFLARQLQHQHSTKSFDYQTKAHPSVVRKEYAVFLPPLEEQDAIAKLFTDMDADITALENQLAKARQIKQGMMQELLTGRIRLV